MSKRRAWPAFLVILAASVAGCLGDDPADMDTIFDEQRYPHPLVVEAENEGDKELDLSVLVTDPYGDPLIQISTLMEPGASKSWSTAAETDGSHSFEFEWSTPRPIAVLGQEDAKLTGRSSFDPSYCPPETYTLAYAHGTVGESLFTRYNVQGGHQIRYCRS